MIPLGGYVAPDEPHSTQKFFSLASFHFHRADTLSLYQHRILTLYVTILSCAFIYYLSSSLS